MEEDTGSKPQIQTAGKQRQLKAAKQSDEVKELVKIYRIVDGVAPVDEYVNRREKYRVCNMFGKVYSKVLNQSDVTENKNKFYVLQMLENVETQDIFVFFRWGRIGIKGAEALIPFGRNIGAAIAEFESKLHDKAVEGNYEEVQLVFGDEISPEEQEQEMLEAMKSSKVSRKVAELVSDIFSLSRFNEQVREIGYDVKKMPLGKLSQTNLKMGLNLLKVITRELDTKAKDWKSKVESMSSKFYSFIPHDVGFKKMAEFTLDTKEKVHSKLKLLEMLTNMKVAQGIADGNNDKDNKIDQLYSGLGTEINPLDHDSEDFKLLSKYLQSTFVQSPNCLKVELLEAFSLHRPQESQKFKKDLGNRLLLWHGARVSAFANILSQGIKPPAAEAPLEKYKFGKGIYFTDMCAKAAKYCHHDKSEGLGLLLLSDIALGQVNELVDKNPNAASQLAGKNSTKGIGALGPVPKNQATHQEGFVVPLGPAQKTQTAGVTLPFNEYVVYSQDQIKSRFLLKCRFV